MGYPQGKTPSFQVELDFLAWRQSAAAFQQVVRKHQAMVVYGQDAVARFQHRWSLSVSHQFSDLKGFVQSEIEGGELATIKEKRERSEQIADLLSLFTLPDSCQSCRSLRLLA